MDPERDPNLLSYSMRRAHEALVRNVEKHHRVVVVGYFMARDPWTQAKLWRRSRTTVEVQRGLRRLEHLKLPFLRSVLEEVGPQASGPWATNALPGLSWHQWGEATDYYVVGPDGSPVWDEDDRGYLVLAEEAARLGLTSGYFWRNQDAGHVQEKRAEVHHVHSWSRIDQQMKARWAA